MVATDNADVGIKIYNKSNAEVSVNNGKLPADMGNTTIFGRKNGSVTFSAAPASFTGARPQPGVFNATATDDLICKLTFCGCFMTAVHISSPFMKKC